MLADDGSVEVIRLEAATVLLQWSVGGMAFCWFTTRRRMVGLGYGWLLRGVYGLMALGSLVLGLRLGSNLVRDVSAGLVAVLCLLALVMSFRRRSAGVSGQRAEHDRRSARVAAMSGIERHRGTDASGVELADAPGTSPAPSEFDPTWDLAPVAVGLIGLAAAAMDTDANMVVSVIRTLAGACFLGAITDAMLLGHWYLVQPGLPRRLLHELVDALCYVWPVEVVALLLPTGMISVWAGTVDDGWGGVLGWFWAACAATTIVLVIITKAALREREYSAVMAATGLLYLAILTAFGTDLVARAVLSG